MLHFLHRRCRLLWYDEFINSDDPGWYQSLTYPISCLLQWRIMNRGWRNENNSQWMMMTEKGKQARLPMGEMRSEIVSVDHARWISVQFYINISLNDTSILLAKQTSDIPRFSVAAFGSRIQTPKYTGVKCQRLCKAFACPNPPKKQWLSWGWWFQLTGFRANNFLRYYLSFTLVCYLPGSCVAASTPLNESRLTKKYWKPT